MTDDSDSPPPPPPAVDIVLEACHHIYQLTIAHCANAHSAHSHDDAAFIAAASECLTYRWFKRQWLSTGVRIAPLLVLYQQPWHTRMTNTALTPLPQPQSLSQSLSLPLSSLSHYTLSLYDTVTSAIIRARHSVQRMVCYYALYTAYQTQLTQERLPIPLPQSLWTIIVADYRMSAQVPVTDFRSLLRKMIAEELFTLTAAYESRLSTMVTVKAKQGGQKIYSEENIDAARANSASDSDNDSDADTSTGKPYTGVDLLSPLTGDPSLHQYRLRHEAQQRFDAMMALIEAEWQNRPIDTIIRQQQSLTTHNNMGTNINNGNEAPQSVSSTSLLTKPLSVWLSAGFPVNPFATNDLGWQRETFASLRSRHQHPTVDLDAIRSLSAQYCEAMAPLRRNSDTESDRLTSQLNDWHQSFQSTNQAVQLLTRPSASMMDNDQTGNANADRVAFLTFLYDTALCSHVFAEAHSVELLTPPSLPPRLAALAARDAAYERARSALSYRSYLEWLEQQLTKPTVRPAGRKRIKKPTKKRLQQQQQQAEERQEESKQEDEEDEPGAPLPAVWPLPQPLPTISEAEPVPPTEARRGRANKSKPDTSRRPTRIKAKHDDPLLEASDAALAALAAVERAALSLDDIASIQSEAYQLKHEAEGAVESITGGQRRSKRKRTNGNANSSSV